MRKILLSVIATLALGAPAYAGPAIDFATATFTSGGNWPTFNNSPGVDNTSFDGIAISGFTYSGGVHYSQTKGYLWLRNNSDDHGLGYCSKGESCGHADTKGNGDANELSNENKTEIIRLTKPSGKSWSDIWVSSLDTGGSNHNDDKGGSNHNDDKGGSNHNDDKGGSNHNDDKGGSNHNEDMGGSNHNDDKGGSNHNDDKGGSNHNEDMGGSNHNEMGTLYWSNDPYANLNSISTFKTFSHNSSGFGSSAEGSIFGLLSGSGFEANANYLFFRAGPSGTNNDYLVWGVDVVDVSSPVPEPEIYAMMGIGLALMGFVDRRRRQQSGRM